eukprot:jgi/Mesvir1/29313/Mv01571-RA.1
MSAKSGTENADAAADEGGTKRKWVSTEESREEAARWIADRRKNYPTRAHVEEKQAKRAEQAARGELIDEDRQERRKRLREILQLQQQMGLPTCEVPLDDDTRGQDAYGYHGRGRSMGRGRGGVRGRGGFRGRGRGRGGGGRFYNDQCGDDEGGDEDRGAEPLGEGGLVGPTGDASARENGNNRTEEDGYQGAGEGAGGGVVKGALAGLLGYDDTPGGADGSSQHGDDDGGSGAAGVAGPANPGDGEQRVASSNGALPRGGDQVAKGVGTDASGGGGGGSYQRPSNYRTRPCRPQGGDANGGHASKVVAAPQAHVAKTKKPPSLLEKLLAKEIRRDKSYLLQAFRFFVNNDFFSDPRADLVFFSGGATEPAHAEGHGSDGAQGLAIGGPAEAAHLKKADALVAAVMEGLVIPAQTTEVNDDGDGDDDGESDEDGDSDDDGEKDGSAHEGGDGEDGGEGSGDLVGDDGSDGEGETG